MAGIYAKAQRDPAAREADRTNSQGGVSWPWRHPRQDETTERPASLAARSRVRHRRAGPRGSDPLAHPVDCRAEFAGRAGARRHDLERRAGAGVGLGRRAPGARVRQDPGAAGKRNRPPAEPDPSLHQPAEPRTVRGDPAAARSGARHADHARLDRPDAVRIGGGTGARHRALPQRLWRIARRAGDDFENLRRRGPDARQGHGRALFDHRGRHRPPRCADLAVARKIPRGVYRDAGRRERLLSFAWRRIPPRTPAEIPRRSRKPSR